VSEWKSFRTLDSRAAATRFAVWNDTHEHDETIRKLDEKTPREGIDFLLWNGDVCNDWHRETDLAKVLLSPGGRDITDGRPLLPVWGNHDVRGAWAYRMPEFVATPEGRPYYAFRSGPVAAVCLHTGEDKPDAHPSFGGRVAFEAFRREQADWLRSVIRGPELRDAPYRVVFCHIPLRWKEERVLSQSDYEPGNYDAFSRFSREAWHEVLVAWGAQVVVSGHTHRVAWIPASEGFPYAQLTGGGPQEERATWIEGQADSASLTLTVRSLTGETLEAVSCAPRVG
jgi:predicted phosphodiesterase